MQTSFFAEIRPGRIGVRRCRTNFFRKTLTCTWLCCILLCCPVLSAFTSKTYAAEKETEKPAQKLRFLTYPAYLDRQIRFCLEKGKSPQTPLSPALLHHLEYTLHLLEAIDVFLNTAPDRVPPLLTDLQRTIKSFPPDMNPIYDKILEEILLNLERRALLFRLTYDSLKENEKNPPRFERTLTEFHRIYERTSELKSYFAQFSPENVRDWDEFFVLSEFYDWLREKEEQWTSDDSRFNDEANTTIADISKDAVSHFITLRSSGSRSEDSQETIPFQDAVYLSDNANLILNRFSLPLTQKQKSFLEVPAIKEWKNELDHWREDTVHPLHLLAAMEKYELNRSISDSAQLADISNRLLRCKSQKHQQLGKVAQTIYSEPNLKLYISDVLLNHFIPKREPEFDRIHETVAGREVVGRRRTDTVVKLAFEPDPKRLKIALRVNGKVAATGRTQVRRTNITSETYATFRAVKPLELTDSGIKPSPTKVQVNNRTYLSDIQTGADGLPFLGVLVKDIAQNQFASQEDRILAESKVKIMKTVASRVNNEVDGHIYNFNRQFHEMILDPLHQIGLEMEMKGSSTTKHWLLSSWRLHCDGSLSSHTQEPETVSGAFADMKVHESALKTIIQRFDLAGKTMTVAELRQWIIEKCDHIQYSNLFGEGENDDALIAFAEKDPICVRFYDDRIEFSLALAAMKIKRRVWKNFRFVVNYTPSNDSQGNLCLVRENAYVIGQKNARTQFTLRTVITKLFPPNQTISLVPKFFENDDRFAGLTLGMCRLERGWLAIALIGKAYP